ncbi:zinc ribbon domain-containing protein [Halobacillus amylolyticus]|uniref:Zinc ribbon domain-containing protein n=1 Tax=Halobacillus amylolyticus TaxID=2932259 RepID=A0ABY4HCD8_9BACI|nr:zinc ribbon domain-containing protein [Halobacillus amylolyticus]UOR11580.1 zinc ribbon domain-containing protein [Halobacillus amylolyticus]
MKRIEMNFNEERKSFYMICPNCNHEQESGRFCGVCGTEISTEQPVHQLDKSADQQQQQQQFQSAATEVQPQSDSMAKAKQASSQFGKNALQLLKRPSIAFTSTENHFVSGLVTMAIYITAFTLSLYLLANKFYKLTMGGFSSLMGESSTQQSLPFFKVVSPIFLFVLLFLAAATVTIFVAIKMMNINFSFQKAVAQYGGLIIPFTTLNIAAIVFGYSGSIGFTLVSLNASLVFTVFILPAIMVYHYGMNSPHKSRNIYWGVGTSAVIMLITYFIVRTFALDFIERMQEFTNIL